MTAGRGIVHSERTRPERRVDGEPIHGLQMWVALPAAKEEMEAGFAHHATAEFPIVKDNGKNVRVVVGIALWRIVTGADRARDDVRRCRI